MINGETAGYTERFRKTVIRLALAAWKNMLELDRTGERPLYWERAWHRAERNKEGEMTKKHLLRNLGGQENNFTVFCPMLPRGKLAARYVAEQSGVPLSALLYSYHEKTRQILYSRQQEHLKSVSQQLLPLQPWPTHEQQGQV